MILSEKPDSTFRIMLEAETKQRQRERAAAYFIGCMTPGQTAHAFGRSCAGRTRKSLHRAFVVEVILTVLDDGGNRLQRELTVGVLHHVLQVKILDRDVVVAVFERAADRLEVYLLHL